MDDDDDDDNDDDDGDEDSKSKIRFATNPMCDWVPVKCYFIFTN